MFLDSKDPFSLMTVFVMTSTFLILTEVIYGTDAVNLTSQEVTLDDGTLVLGSLETLGQHQVAAFRGIPYAMPPVGPLRFKKPVVLMSPNVTQFNATQYGPTCLFVPPRDGQGEDCLYLNVWVPVGGSSKPPFAVLVRIHGGGFFLGSGFSPPGDFLAAENGVIVVAMNYRLGPLGFLSTGDSASVGNYGLWDQHAALLWVQRNIAAFGGDPGAVTLMGESAGAMSVSFHMISHHSSDLFHRAIMQSGTVYCPLALQWTPAETTLRLAQAVGCGHSAHDALVDCLRDKPARLIANASTSLWLHDAVRTFIDSSWAPVEDGDFVPPLYAKNGTLLPLPSSTTTTTAFNGTVMIGVNNNEGSLLIEYRLPVVEQAGHTTFGDKLVNPDFFKEQLVPGVLQQMFKTLPNDSAMFSTAAEVITYKYRGWTSGLPTLTKPDLHVALGDPSFVSPSFQFVSQWLTSGLIGRDQVYVYVFDNYPDVPAEEGMEGMKHADDMAYTFGTVEAQLRKLNVSDAVVTKETKLGENFRKLLTNFAKSGNPFALNTLSGWPEWPLYNLQNQTYLAIFSTPRTGTRYRAETVALWSDLVPTIVTSQPVKCPEGPREDGTSAARSCFPHHLALTCGIALVIWGLADSRN